MSKLSSENVIEKAIVNAIENGHSKLTHKLLNGGFAFNSGNFALAYYRMLDKDDATTLQVIIDNNITIPTQYPRKALERNAVECTKLFIKHDPSFIPTLERSQKRRKDMGRCGIVDKALENGYVEIAKLLIAQGMKITNFLTLEDIRYSFDKTNSIAFALSLPEFDSHFDLSNESGWFNDLAREDRRHAPVIVQALIDNKHMNVINNPAFIQNLLKESSTNTLAVLEANNIDISEHLSDVSNLEKLVNTPSFYLAALSKESYITSVTEHHKIDLYKALFASNNIDLINQTLDLKLNENLHEDGESLDSCHLLTNLLGRCTDKIAAKALLDGKLGEFLAELNLADFFKSIDDASIYMTLQVAPLDALIDYMCVQGLTWEVNDIFQVFRGDYSRLKDVIYVQGIYPVLRKLVSKATDGVHSLQFASDAIAQMSSKQQLNALRTAIKNENERSQCNFVLDLIYFTKSDIAGLINCCDTTDHELNPKTLEFLLATLQMTPSDAMLNPFVTQHGKKLLLDAMAG